MYAPEFVPLAKAGGLGDVTAGLSRYLTGVGHDVVTLLPRYGIVDAPVRATQPVAGPIKFSVRRRDALVLDLRA